MIIELLMDDDGRIWMDTPNLPYIEIPIKLLPQDLIDELHDENESLRNTGIDNETE